MASFPPHRPAYHQIESLSLQKIGVQVHKRRRQKDCQHAVQTRSDPSVSHSAARGIQKIAVWFETLAVKEMRGKIREKPM